MLLVINLTAMVLTASHIGAAGSAFILYRKACGIIYGTGRNIKPSTFGPIQILLDCSALRTCLALPFRCPKKIGARKNADSSLRGLEAV